MRRAGLAPRSVVRPTGKTGRRYSGMLSLEGEQASDGTWEPKDENPKPAEGKVGRRGSPRISVGISVLPGLMRATAKGT